MLNCRKLLLAVLLPLAATNATAVESRDPDPLFRDHAPLEITITGPMKTLLGERPNDTYLRGTLSYREADGRTVDFDVGIRTRGNFRRDRRICPFPPLRINFKKSEVKGTLFRQQNKLKLVAHCRDKSDRHEQNVIEEYLAYRILNTLTDISYKVRLAHITYVDSEQEYDNRVRYAFFIEHKKRVAQRLDLPVLSTGRIQTPDLAGPHSDLTSLFQFMIGNTDFSPIAGPEGEDCCHNSTLFGNDGGPIYSVPYDFDMSGLVDAPYAAPDPNFRIRRVTQRLYRGRCYYIGHLESSVQLFQDERETIYGLFDNQQELENSSRKRAIKFIDRFYDVIDDPRKRQREIEDRCIGVGQPE